jgi:hypothetical protein
MIGINAAMSYGCKENSTQMSICPEASMAIA